MFGNKFSTPKLVLILFVLFTVGTLLGMTAYLASVKPPVTVQPTPTPVTTPSPTTEPIVTPTPEPTVLPTSTPNMDITNWKTYINKEYNFELKYPKIFILGSLTQDDKDRGIVGTLRTEDSTTEVSGSVIFTIKKEKFDMENVKIPAEEMKYTPYILINGVQSYIMAGGDGPCGFAYIAIPRDNYYIRLLFSDCGSSDNKIYFANDYRDQMLSTFKFTN